MGKTYNGKIVLVSTRTTKNQLAEQVSHLLTEVADIMVDRNNLRIERDALKEVLMLEHQENHHLSIQLEVAKEKIERLKHYNRNLINDHNTDVIAYALGGSNIFRNGYDGWPKMPVKEPVIDFAFMKKTWLERIFDYFQI